MKEYDYIIVGAGAAGCVLAYRLSADPAVSVLLIEAGGRDRHPFIHMPKGIAKAMADPSLIWPYMTTPAAVTAGNPESWARGRTLGGSSSINGMVYVRGQDADFDALAAVSSADWSWREIGAAYKAMEGHELGAAPTRGGDGPLRITMPDRAPLMDAAIAAGEAMGMRRKDDVNDPEDCERIGYVPRTIHNGRRQSAAVAFLDPARGRANLTIATDLVVADILFDGLRARGVRALRGDRARGDRAEEIIAAREVILAAGTMATPAILQRSGIGPADHLRELGITVRHDSPEVGENLREHRGLVMQWRVPDELSQNRDFRGLRLVGNTLRYALTRTGPMANAAYEVGGWFRTRPELARPDAQILVAPFTFDFSGPTVQVEAHGGMNICAYGLRPESRGSVRIRSTDPRDLPEIMPNYCGDAADRQLVVDLVRQVRRYVAQGPLAELILAETRPGPAFDSDDEIFEAYRRFGYGSYHASGSCRMGRDDAAVVDPELRVRGVEGLRIVDTSIFPFILSGNTNGPAMAMAWRAADLIGG